MGFADSLLSDDEELLAEVRPHPVLLAGPAVLLVCALAGAVTIAIEFPGAPAVVAWLLAAMVVLPALWLAGRALRTRAVRFVVTSARLVYRRGVLRRDVVQLRLHRVAEVHLRQSIRGRIIGYGQLVFEVVGGDGPLVVDDLRRPRSLQRTISAQLDRLDVPRRGPATPSAHGEWGPSGGPGPWETAAMSPPPSRAAAPFPQGGWSDTPPSGVPVPVAGTVPDQLLQLDELRRRGIVSDAEFTAKKAELLARL